MNTSIQDKTDQELERRLEEIRYLGTHFAMNGCEHPADLEKEYSAIAREIERRKAAPPAKRP